MRTYFCYVAGWEESGMNVTSMTASKARYKYWLELDGYDIPYINIRSRQVGSIVTSEAFKMNAEYRNIPFAFCGMKVSTTEGDGIIIGHNSSANLDVYFLTGPHKGLTLNCHPHHQIAYYDKAGKCIQSFIKDQPTND